MPYKMSWLIDKRVLYQHCFGDLTIEELKANNQEVIKYLREGTPLVHTIVDLRDVTNFPKNLSQYGQAFKRNPEDIALLGWTIVVGTNPIFKFFGNVITNLWKQARYRMVDTYEQAETFLAERDGSLDFSKAQKENVPTRN